MEMRGRAVEPPTDGQTDMRTRTDVFSNPLSPALQDFLLRIIRMPKQRLRQGSDFSFRILTQVQVADFRMENWPWTSMSRCAY